MTSRPCHYCHKGGQILPFYEPRGITWAHRECSIAAFEARRVRE